jgi:hypothetical protein
MKKRTKGVVLLVAVLLGLVAWLVILPLWGRIRDYGEAEPLVEVIWPMAGEMKRFSEERGRAPNSLDEITRFSPGHDFSALRRYPHEFSTTGPRRFCLRVNRRFAFVIDEHFSPGWLQMANVLGTPTTPK